MIYVSLVFLLLNSTFEAKHLCVCFVERYKGPRTIARILYAVFWGSCYSFCQVLLNKVLFLALYEDKKLSYSCARDFLLTFLLHGVSHVFCSCKYGERNNKTEFKQKELKQIQAPYMEDERYDLIST